MRRVYLGVAPPQIRAHTGAMPRTAIAALVFLIGFTTYVAVVVTLADHVFALNWSVQAAYFIVAGVAWAWPARALMFWAAQPRK